MHEIKTFPYTPALGWSVSRYDTFRACKRQYYYTYYGKHDPVVPRDRIEMFKKMTTIPLEKGNIVHDVIAVLLQRLLKSQRHIDANKFFDYTQRKTEQYCRSKQFAEVYYGETACIDTDSLFSDVRHCMENFLESDRHLWLLEKAGAAGQHWVIEPGGYGETRIDGMKAYCKVDFLFPVDGRFYILDWKTGKPNERKHRKQLVGYVTWATYHFDTDASRITPILAYLAPVYREAVLDVNEFDIEEFRRDVRAERDEMTAYCEDREENIPRDKEAFPKTMNVATCKYCNYRELCGVCS